MSPGPDRAPWQGLVTPTVTFARTCTLSQQGKAQTSPQNHHPEKAAAAETRGLRRR